MIGRSTLVVVAVALASCPLAWASVTNGDFEAGSLTGWNGVGPVGAVTEEYARDILGLPQAPLSGIWQPAGGSYFASLWSTDSMGTDAAVLSQTFEGEAGTLLRFDYFFDFGDFAPAYDTALATLDGPGGPIVLLELNTPGHELADDQNIDWTTVSYTLGATGTYTLEFRTGDASGVFESILGIDDVQVGVVPAPGALVLGAIGMGLLSWARRRRVL